ncbi:MAG: hypothetical protein AB1632_00575 [Nitrospirota bacterium]
MHFDKNDFPDCPSKFLLLSVSFIAITLSLLFIASCGKKGAPTLKSYEKPEPPSFLRAIHRENEIILRWDFPKDKESEISDFIIFKSSGTGFSRMSHIERTRRSHVDADFKTGQTYSYKIISRNFRGIYSDDSNIINITPLNFPAPPANITFRIEDGSLVLEWEKSGDGILYNIYKSPEKNAYGLDPANKSPLSENYFRDVFNINKIFYYSIRSLTKNDIRDEGPMSEEIIVNPSEFVPPSPEDLRYFAADDRIFLYWKEPSETWVTGFRIYRKLGNQDYKLIGETQIPAFLDTESPTIMRDYRVSSVGPSKEGSPAEIKGAVFIPEIGAKRE